MEKKEEKKERKRRKTKSGNKKKLCILESMASGTTRHIYREMCIFVAYILCLWFIYTIHSINSKENGNKA